ncbi:MAG: GGDEF domain-containing protein [Pseudobutyrivibrio sp.]|nr:GGDEF domain-containing protein [Pseudobutyrivibrio sp.]
MILAKIGYFFIYLLDPADVVFALFYIDSLMDQGNERRRYIFRSTFEILATINIIAVTFSVVFDTKWFYYFDGTTYIRGPYFLLRAGGIMVMMLFLNIYALEFKANILNDYRRAVIYLPSFSFVGAILQVFFANLDTTYAGISLGCLIVFFYIQNRNVNIDYLTGIYNRRGLDISMEEKVKWSKSNGRDFSAVMLDVDNFKVINDNYGHEAGDKAIKELADILIKEYDKDSVIGRYGGDEFCVITDNTSKLELAIINSRVGDEVEMMCVRNGWPKTVGISSGYQVFDHESDMTAPEFQRVIDTLMYSEKQQHHMTNYIHE